MTAIFAGVAIAFLPLPLASLRSSSRDASPKSNCHLAAAAPHSPAMSDFDRDSRRRTEPEIIPPGAPLPGERGSGQHGIWAAADTPRTHYVYATRVGPVGATLLALGFGAVAVMGLLFLLSAAFLGLAVVGAVTVAAVVAGILRRFSQPLR
jgi:hypothetical protein